MKRIWIMMAATAVLALGQNAKATVVGKPGDAATTTVPSPNTSSPQTDPQTTPKKATKTGVKPAVKAAPKAAAKAAPKSAAPAVAKNAAVKKEDGMAIPAGAKELEPGLYRVVDSKGQAWRYQRTPFGFSKYAEKPEVVQTEAVPTDWTAKDEGESVRFERPYPFGGTNSWTRKKSELTDVESAVWKRSQGASK